jgi:ABC-type transport system involved in multi-copper enzyme maturation permease subunit
MPGVWTIAKKEFTDHVSDHTFLLCFGVLILVMLTGTYGNVLDIQEAALRDPSWGEKFGSEFYWKDNYIGFVNNIIQPFSLLGTLVAIVVSINSISKERTEGSLKVLLSYPLSRGKLILGKALGGAIVLAVVASASLTICFSLTMFYLSIPATYEMLARIVAVVGLGMVLLFFYLFVGTILSILFRDANTILIGSILVISTLRPEIILMTLTSLSNILPYAGIRFEVPRYLHYGLATYFYPSPVFSGIAVFIPTESYLSFSYSIFKFQNIGTYPEIWTIPVTFDWLLPKYLDLVYPVIISAAAAFILCYLIFRRADVS